MLVSLTRTPTNKRFLIQHLPLLLSVTVLVSDTLLTPPQVPNLTIMATDFSENLTQANTTTNILVQWMVSVDLVCAYMCVCVYLIKCL